MHDISLKLKVYWMLRVFVCKVLVGHLSKYEVLLAAKEAVKEGHNFARLSDPPLFSLCLFGLSEIINPTLSVFHARGSEKLLAIGLCRSLGVVALDLSQCDGLLSWPLVCI